MCLTSVLKTAALVKELFLLGRPNFRIVNEYSTSHRNNYRFYEALITVALVTENSSCRQIETLGYLLQTSPEIAPFSFQGLFAIAFIYHEYNWLFYAKTHFHVLRIILCFV